MFSQVIGFIGVIMGEFWLFLGTTPTPIPFITYLDLLVGLLIYEILINFISSLLNMRYNSNVSFYNKEWSRYDRNSGK